MPEFVFLPLSERQNQILKFLHRFLEEKHYPPTIAEIQEEESLINPGLVFKVLFALEKKGYIRRIKGRHRSLQLTDTGIHYINEERQLNLI